ncbi:hypothetical protein BpHYR1_024618 [Brachionus plicatilis]|uniref:Uncharacterized protein n=1 Tax=Brachionus plicatilis TaxID=10195 RepID=A0A3M7SR09_BRAPC|nr:hypothetical protein BpHYR1_024618 [Brachionus plicatilis]
MTNLYYFIIIIERFRSQKMSCLFNRQGKTQSSTNNQTSNLIDLKALEFSHTLTILNMNTLTSNKILSKAVFKNFLSNLHPLIDRSAFKIVAKINTTQVEVYLELNLRLISQCFVCSR